MDVRFPLIILVSMDAAFIQAALAEDKLRAAPKKARKLVFTDQFLFNAVRAWLEPCEDPYERQVKPILSDPDWTAKLAEACVAALSAIFFHLLYQGKG